jgi:hypothetical protein
MARVEVAQDELPSAFAQRESIVAEGKRAGFLFVTLDLAGYRMGSHNEVLKGIDLDVFPGDRIALSAAQQLQLALKNKSGGAIDPHAGHNH